MNDPVREEKIAKARAILSHEGFLKKSLFAKNAAIDRMLASGLRRDDLDSLMIQLGLMDARTGVHTERFTKGYSSDSALPSVTTLQSPLILPVTLSSNNPNRRTGTRLPPMALIPTIPVTSTSNSVKSTTILNTTTSTSMRPSLTILQSPGLEPFQITPNSRSINLNPTQNRVSLSSSSESSSEELADEDSDDGRPPPMALDWSTIPIPIPTMLPTLPDPFNSNPSNSNPFNSNNQTRPLSPVRRPLWEIPPRRSPSPQRRDLLSPPRRSPSPVRPVLPSSPTFRERQERNREIQRQRAQERREEDRQWREDNGQRRVTTQLAPQVVRRNPQPLGPNELVDDFAAAVEFTDLLRVTGELQDRELRLFGQEGELMNEIMELIRYIQALGKPYLDSANGIRRPTYHLLSEYLFALNTLKNRVKSIADKQLALGRRCINSEDYLSMETIDELDDGHFIRLKDGDCWEIESLLDLIRRKGGKNDASSIKSLNRRYIWANREELDRIRKHPIAISSGFTKWFNSLQFLQASQIISEETLNRMARAASLLKSRGSSFQEALEEELNDEQKVALLSAKGDVDRVKNPQLRKEISTTIAITLKSAANKEFHEYYTERLTQEERDAIGVFEYDFDRDIKLCHAGNFCVFGMANTLLATRNAIAELKGLPVLDWDDL